MTNDINVKIQKVELLSIRLNKKKLAYEYCSETEGHQRKTKISKARYGNHTF